MATLLLKKSYRHKDLKEIKFHDLWNSHGVFTTMRIVGKPARILFFKKHINNLFKSLKVYKINKKDIKKNILKLIKINISNKNKYDHYLAIASATNIINGIMPIIKKWFNDNNKGEKGKTNKLVRLMFQIASSRSPLSSRFVIAK